MPDPPVKGANVSVSWHPLPLFTVAQCNEGEVLLQPPGSADKSVVAVSELAGLPSSDVKVIVAEPLEPTWVTTCPVGDTEPMTLLFAVEMYGMSTWANCACPALSL